MHYKDLIIEKVRMNPQFLLDVMQKIEKELDDLYKPLGIDIYLRDPHFLYRIQADKRNIKPIKPKEIDKLFKIILLSRKTPSFRSGM